MAPTVKITSQTLRAVEELSSLIMSGKLAPGSDHLESELALRLGMSRTPIREATLVLEAQGLLEVRPRKGVRILSLTIDDMREIYEVLTELESLAASLAAAKKYTEKQLAKLKKTIHEMTDALTTDDRIRWAAADAAFHDELVRLSGNQRLIQVVSNFNNQVRRARNITLQIRPKPYKSIDDHTELYEAILDADSATARKMHRRHRTRAKLLLIDLLEKHGLHNI